MNKLVRSIATAIFTARSSQARNPMDPIQSPEAQNTKLKADAAASVNMAKYFVGVLERELPLNSPVSKDPVEVEQEEEEEEDEQPTGMTSIPRIEDTPLAAPPASASKKKIAKKTT